MTAEAPEPAQGEGDTATVRIRLPQRAGTRADFANHAVATFMGDSVVITFAQLLPPSGEPDEVSELVASGSIQALPVAQLVMPAGKFAEMAISFFTLVERLREQGRLPAQKGEDDDR